MGVDLSHETCRSLLVQIAFGPQQNSSVVKIAVEFYSRQEYTIGERS